MNYAEMRIADLKMSEETKERLHMRGYNTVKDLLERDIYDEDFLRPVDRQNIVYGLLRSGIDITKEAKH